MKMSLPAYFRTIYGELLAPRGFCLLKSKIPKIEKRSHSNIRIRTQKQRSSLWERLRNLFSFK